VPANFGEPVHRPEEQRRRSAWRAPPGRGRHGGRAGSR
jgi:hypothetical protein